MTLQLDPRQRAMLREMGVHVWLPGTSFNAPLAETEPPPVQRQPAVQAPAPATPAPATPASSTHAAPVATGLGWPALAEAVASCRACGLCEARQRTTLQALDSALAPCDWLVLGDPPDQEEERSGSPFAGADGVLLANMLASVGVQRVNPAGPGQPDQQALLALPASARAYVSNVVKCRPAHGQLPDAADLRQCAVYLQQEIALVRPRLILALGRFAQQLLLSEQPALAQQPLGKLRGRLHRYQGVDVVLSYHPKALMRNAPDKAKAWADLCLAADRLAASR